MGTRLSTVLLVACAASLARAQESEPAPVRAHGQLVIVSEPPGAVVAVDNVAIGAAPITARDLLPGDHLVQAMWPDGAVATSIGVVPEGASASLRLASPASERRPAAAAEPRAAAAAVPVVARREAKPLYKQWWLWTAVGVAAIAVGVGVGVGVGVAGVKPRYGVLEF
jgi:hypothetical protein